MNCIEEEIENGKTIGSEPIIRSKSLKDFKKAYAEGDFEQIEQKIEDFNRELDEMSEIIKEITINSLEASEEIANEIIKLNETKNKKYHRKKKKRLREKMVIEKREETKTKVDDNKIILQEEEISSTYDVFNRAYQVPLEFSTK